MFIIYQHNTNKYCKFVLKLLRHVSVLIHHLQGFYSCVSYRYELLLVCLLMVQQPPVSQANLIHEVSRSHTTTRHSR